jgi:hypothetical protein
MPFGPFVRGEVACAVGELLSLVGTNRDGLDLAGHL